MLTRQQGKLISVWKCWWLLYIRQAVREGLPCHSGVSQASAEQEDKQPLIQLFLTYHITMKYKESKLLSTQQHFWLLRIFNHSQITGS